MKQLVCECGKRYQIKGWLTRHIRTCLDRYAPKNWGPLREVRDGATCRAEQVNQIVVRLNALEAKVYGWVFRGEA